jgi:hypothetical protein
MLYQLSYVREASIVASRISGGLGRSPSIPAMSSGLRVCPERAPQARPLVNG